MDLDLKKRDSKRKKSSSDHEGRKTKRKKSSSRESGSSSEVSIHQHGKKHRKKSKMKKKRRSSDEERHSKKHRKHKKKKSKHDTLEKAEMRRTTEEDQPDIGPALPEPTKQIKPLTKEEWEKQQSVVRRIYDPETGRNRLVKGDGEILEEIVSKQRHKEINKAATVQDGESFKKHLGLL